MTERDATADQSFLDRESADAFAKHTGGDVEAVGTAFVVHPATAKDAGQDASKDSKDSKESK